MLLPRPDNPYRKVIAAGNSRIRTLISGLRKGEIDLDDNFLAEASLDEMVAHAETT